MMEFLLQHLIGAGNLGSLRHGKEVKFPVSLMCNFCLPSSQDFSLQSLILVAAAGGPGSVWALGV